MAAVAVSAAGVVETLVLLAAVLVGALLAVGLALAVANGSVDTLVGDSGCCAGCQGYANRWQVSGSVEG